ncbi:MAG: hypothetical protein WKF84_11825 [Pyrinomonadaceae bacterium]
MAVRYLSRLGLMWCQTQRGELQTVKVYPNLRRAREAELKALGAQSLVSAHRRARMPAAKGASLSRCAIMCPVMN